MSKTKIPPRLRRKIELSAGYCCGYCLTPQRITGQKLQIDHIIPETLGGATVEENLWLACVSCNSFKGDTIQAPDPLTGQITPLFNPRSQIWIAHFAWSVDGTEIVGLTPIGRATCEALHLNHVDIVGARWLWVQVGWWPPGR